MKTNSCFELSRLFLSPGLALFAAMLALTGCDKASDEDFTDAGDMLRVDALTESTLESVDAATLRFGAGATCDWPDVLPACATVVSGSGTYPDTTVITFDPGCMGPGGYTRSGSLVVILSDDLAIPGAVRTVIFDGYEIDGYGISGQITLENTGTDLSGNPVFSRIADLIWTFPSATLERNFVGTRTWISGWTTPECLDNVFDLSGSGSLSGPWGTSTQTILEPLRVDRSCGYIIDGTLQLDGPRGLRTLDYGDGSCDDLADLTVPSGETYTVDLDLFRFRRR